MNKYVSPIIEIEKVEVEDIVMTDSPIESGENELPVIPLPGMGGKTNIPDSLDEYFN